MAVIDLSGLRVRDLLRLEAGVVAELRDRGLVRTNNKPLGDIAEQVVLRPAYRDLLLAMRHQLQVEARRATNRDTPPPRSPQGRALDVVLGAHAGSRVGRGWLAGRCQGHWADVPKMLGQRASGVSVV